MSKHEIFTVLMTLINLVWRLAFVYIWTKFRLINRVATVYLLQCKTNFFIHLCFYGKNLRQIKEDLSWNIQINIQKDFFWFIYTRRRPSTSVSRDFLISNLGSFRVISLISMNFFRVMILFSGSPLQYSSLVTLISMLWFSIENSGSQQRKVFISKVSEKQRNTILSQRNTIHTAVWTCLAWKTKYDIVMHIVVWQMPRQTSNN